jgi:hypothetical protein
VVGGRDATWTLRAAGLGPGDDVRVVAAGQGRLGVLRVDELIDQFAGIVGRETYPPGYLEELRREWRWRSSTPTS